MVLTNLRKVSKRTLLVHCLALGVVLTAIFVVFIAPSLLSTVGRDSSLTGRRDLWVLVSGMVRNPLFGTGFDSFWLGPRVYQVWSIYRFRPYEAHEGYIEVYINLGWIGIALLANMILRGYGKMVRAVRDGVVMSNLGLTYIAVALIYNLSESGFQQVFPVWVALLAAITATGAVPILLRPQPPEVVTDEKPEPVADQVWFGSPLLL